MRWQIAISVVVVMLTAGVLGSCSKPVAAVPQSARVGVTIADTGITAAQTTFLSGVRYHFTVTNRGSHPHELTIERTNMQQMAMGGMNGMATSGNIAPEGTATLDYIFDSAAKQQDLEFGCYYQGHQDLRLHIQVT
jgi:uncharacterized cupredoxin-like copper-binding protein